MYTINDVAQMTGLSTRTVRNYLKMDLLEGEKADGVWQFTPEQVSDFLSHPTVKPSIQAKRNATVYDFLADRKKKINSACVMLDLNADSQEAQEVSDFFCTAVHGFGGLEFSYSYDQGYVRVILSGPEDAVAEILGRYYSGPTSR